MEAYYKDLNAELHDVVDLLFSRGVNTLRLEDLRLLESTADCSSRRIYLSSLIKALDLWHVYPAWRNLDPLKQLLCYPKKLEDLRFGNYPGDIDQIELLSVLEPVKNTLKRLDIEYMTGLRPVDVDTTGFQSFGDLTFLRVDHKFMEQILGNGKGIEDVLPTQLEEVSITFNDGQGFLLHGWTTEEISLLGPIWDTLFPNSEQYLEKGTFDWLLKLLDYKRSHKTALRRVQITDRRNSHFISEWSAPKFLEDRLIEIGVELEVIVTKTWQSRDKAIYTVVTPDRKTRELPLIGDNIQQRVKGASQGASEKRTFLVLMIFAVLSALVLFAISLVAARYGLGKHIWNLDSNLLNLPAEVSRLVKLLFACSIAYSSAITLTKCAIITSYLRIFPHKNLRIILVATGFVVISFWIASVFVIIFTCIPVQAAWDFTMQGKCFPVVTFFYVYAGFNIATDIILCLAPMPLLWAMNLPTRQKSIVCILFGIGLFACVTSILRLTQLYELGAADLSYECASSLSWSCAEVGTAIICASLSSLRPLASKIFPNLFSHFTHNAGTYPSTSVVSEANGNELLCSP